MSERIVTLKNTPEKSLYKWDNDDDLQLVVSKNKTTYKHLVQYGSNSYVFENRETDIVELSLLSNGNLAYSIGVKGYTDGYTSWDRVMKYEEPHRSKKIDIENEIANKLNYDNSAEAFVIKTFLSEINDNSLVNGIKQNLYPINHQRMDDVSEIIKRHIEERKRKEAEEKKKEDFMAHKKMLSEHPEMLGQCLKSMCIIYTDSKDQDTKRAMLKDLYHIRKGAATNREKRRVAHAFKHILDSEPNLQKNEFFVALSRVDTLFSTPTNLVKKNIDRCL